MNYGNRPCLAATKVISRRKVWTRYPVEIYYMYQEVVANICYHILGLAFAVKCPTELPDIFVTTDVPKQLLDDMFDWYIPSYSIHNAYRLVLVARPNHRQVSSWVWVVSQWIPKCRCKCCSTRCRQ